MADIVAQSGATITSFEEFFFRTEEHSKDIIDIGVLRYPDLNRPLFHVSRPLVRCNCVLMQAQIYRIKLYAWSKSTRVLFHQEDSNGIFGG